MSNPSSDEPTTADQELLVAYLDGELDAEASECVERRLAEDEAFRLQLRGMQEAWDLLDDLPQATLDEKFTRTTLEMAAIQVREEMQPQVGFAGWPSALRRSAPWLAVVACGLVGFLATRGWQLRRERQTLEDIPVIQRMDQYGHLDSVQFLEALANSGLFEAEATEDLTRDVE